MVSAMVDESPDFLQRLELAEVSPRARARVDAVVVCLVQPDTAMSERGNAGKTSVEPSKVSPF